MQTKILEIRDVATYFAVLCVDMNPGEQYPANGTMTEDELEQSLEAYTARRYHLRRVGYPCDGRPNIGITHLSANGRPFNNDPYSWGGRTYPVAHNYIIEKWAELKDGDVVDVEFILGETTQPKQSELYAA